MRAGWVMVALVWVASVATGAEWPQFQGPSRDGVSPETGLVGSWPDGGPKVAWTNDRLGTGYGGAVVAAGKVYIMDRVNDQQDVLRCLDLDTGREEWTFAYDAPMKYKGGYNGSRNLPVVEGEFVWALGPLGDLNCVSIKTHASVWHRNIVTGYEAVISNWGFCQSPVLYRNTVIVAPVSKKAGVVALDKTTGEEVWKSERIGDVGWTSPLVATVEGVDQVVMLHSRGEPRLSGLDAATGKVLWTYKGWKCANPIASPISVGEGRFFITGGYGAGSALVRATREGEGWKVDEVLKTAECGSQAQNPIFYRGDIYANSSDTGSGVMCLGLDGKVRWKTSNDSKEEIGSILIADGKIFSLLSEKGNLRIIEATPEAHRELASAPITKGRNIWGPMALSDGRLLVRNRRQMICIDLRAPKP